MEPTMLGIGDFPLWVTIVSIVSLAIGVGCALWVVADVVRRPQHMAIMNWVWPLTMLFGGLLWLWLYVRHGRAPASHGEGDTRDVPMRVSVAKGASHCGAGCSLGDLVGEGLVVLVPGLTAAVGLTAIFSDDMYARWVVDFVFAFGFGVIFQYFTIAPMQGLSLGPGLWQAIKADAASISAWQVGMYGLMALAQLWILPALLDGRVAVMTPQFWWIMQIAMLAGFATSYPVNWWLVRVGVKEAM